MLPVKNRRNTGVIGAPDYVPRHGTRAEGKLAGMFLRSLIGLHLVGVRKIGFVLHGGYVFPASGGKSPIGDRLTSRSGSSARGRTASPRALLAVRRVTVALL